MLICQVRVYGGNGFFKNNISPKTSDHGLSGTVLSLLIGFLLWSLPVVEVEPNQHFLTRKLGLPQRDFGGSDGFGSQWELKRYIFGHICRLNTRSHQMCGFRCPCGHLNHQNTVIFQKYRYYCSTSTAGNYQSRDPINKLSTVPERPWSEVLCGIIFLKKTL